MRALLLLLTALTMANRGAMAETSDEELRSRSGNSGSKERIRKKRSAKAARIQKEGSASGTGAADPADGPPPWLSFALEEQTKKVTASIRQDLAGTLGMISDNLKNIAANQKESDRKIEGLAHQQAGFETTQAKFQMELQLLKAAANNNNGPSSAGGSTAAPEGGANPYSARHEPRELDKARFIVGGWKNALSPVMEKQIRTVIAMMAEKPSLESLELGGTRNDYCFIKFLPQPGHSALQLGGAFKSLLYSQKISAVGNPTKVLWAQPNRTLEARSWRKSINGVRRFLHSVREVANLPLTYVEHNETTEIISADYRANKRHVAWKGQLLCSFPTEGEVQ